SKVDMLESIRWPTILMSTTIARYIPAVPSTVAMASAGVTHSSASIVIPVPLTSSSLTHAPRSCTCSRSVSQGRMQGAHRPGAFLGHHHTRGHERRHAHTGQHQHVPYQVLGQPAGEHDPQPV